jgi:hypothetical protein
MNYISSPTGLSTILQQYITTHSTPTTNTSPPILLLTGTAIVLDFDRTLTNGYRAPSEMDIRRRIRGGVDTVKILTQCKELGAELFVVSARAGREMIIDTMALSFDGALQELKPLFIRDDDKFSLTTVGTEQIAVKGSLYATDYKKRAAIIHISQRMSYSPLHKTKSILFFDDFVGNAFDIGTMKIDNVTIYSYWWDPFNEEVEKHMAFASSESTDNSYKQEYFDFGYLPAFGITQELRNERYKQYEIHAPSTNHSSVSKPKPTPGKLKMEGFNGLILPGGAGRGSNNISVPPSPTTTTTTTTSVVSNNLESKS